MSLISYEVNISESKKKSLAAFYTDEKLVNYILKNVYLDDNTIILEPSCGNGAFLRGIEKKLGKNFNINNCFAVDIDKDVIKLLKNYFNKYQNFNSDHILTGNFLENKIKFLKTNTSKFDLIIGNPPYLTGKDGENFTASLFNFSDYISGSTNLSALSLLRALDLIKENGEIAFILPKNILHVEAYKKIRERIIKDFTIESIVDIGTYFKNVRGEQIILFIKNKKPEEKHEILIKKITKKSELIFEESRIQQKLFNSEFKICLYDGKIEIDLLNKLEKAGIKLERFINGKICRGIAIVNDDKEIIAFRGRDIKKFGTKSHIIGHPLMKNGEKIDIILSKKIIMQNIFSSEAGLIASYVGENTLTTETVTNITDSDEKKLKYILTLLNSKVLNYFLVVKIFNDSRLTMHTDRKYVGALPIAYNEDYYDTLIKICDNALNNKYIKIQDIIKKIDEIAYKIYNLNADEIEFIEKKMSKIYSKDRL